MNRRPAAAVSLAVTGGIGSGKSSVCRCLAGLLDVPLIDIDELCRELLTRKQAGWELLRRHLDRAFFTAEDEIDRPRLRRALFADAGFRQRIDGLIHPLAHAEMEKRIAACDAEMLLVDVPLLYEAGWQGEFTRSIVVYAQGVTRCRRLVRRDGLDPDEVLRSLQSQMPLWQKALRADHVIDNNGCWIRTRLQVIRLAVLLREEYKSPVSGCPGRGPGRTAPSGQRKADIF